MDIIYSIICITLSFSIFLLYFKKWKMLKLYLLKFNDNTSLFDLLMFVCFVKLALYYCLPSITHLITGWKPVYAEKIAPIEVVEVYLVEAFSYLIYIYTIQFFIKKKKPNISMTRIKSSKLFTIGILGLAALVYIDSTSVLGKSESSLDSLFLIIPFVRNCGIFLVLYIIVKGKTEFDKLTIYIALITLLAFLGFAITSGVRSLMVWPILFFLYFSYSYNKRMMKVYMPIGLLGVCFMVFFQESLVAMRGTDAKAIERISNMGTSKSIGTIIGNLFEEVDFRFGAMTTYGVGYFRLVDKGKSAGLNPIINSCYAPIPRRFFENKPIPCSSDGTEEGEGMYIATKEASATITYSMTEPPTGAHAYWELGFLGVIILSIVPAIYVMTCMCSFRKFGILAIPLYMVIFKLEYLEPKLWVSCIILQLVQVNFPAYFLKKIYLRMAKKH